MQTEQVSKGYKVFEKDCLQLEFFEALAYGLH